MCTGARRNIHAQTGTLEYRAGQGIPNRGIVVGQWESSGLLRALGMERMTIRTQRIRAELAALARYLADRREPILENWRQTAESDTESTIGSSLSRAQFNDHIPAMLDAFEHRLCAQDNEDGQQAVEQQNESAADHGMVRWQQGYDQRQVMREWSLLHLCLLDELEHYAATHRELDFSTMPIARRVLMLLCNEGMIEGASHHARMQQAEAATRQQNLEHALTQLNELDRQRAELWREAAHDLRGNLGTLQGAALGLNKDGVPPAMRARFLALLQSGVTSLQALLSDLLSLARLEAGHEQRCVSAFDVAVVLADLCASFQPQACERGLLLQTEGPETLAIEGDAVKIRRIAQNLIVNALKYTARGGVKVRWEAVSRDAGECWRIAIQDTGPGFLRSSISPVAGALKEATDEAQTVEREVLPGEQADQPAPTLPSQSQRPPKNQPAGEGVGLSIVKRLCELLDASLELETAPGEGTTFRITFPREYEKP